MLPFPIFDKIYVVDFEFIARPSEKQQPVCVVSHELKSGETKRVWLYDVQNPEIPYTFGKRDLFVGYFSSAEWNCHKALNWPMPQNVVDLFVEYRNETNHSGMVKVESNLLAACKAYGIETIDREQKDFARDKILRGGPYSVDDQEFIMKYCESDVLETAELFQRMISSQEFELSTALFRGEYMKAVSEMEFSGIPVDVDLLKLLQDNWDNIKLRLIKDIDEWGIYEGTTFKTKIFENLVINKGWSWPTTEKGNLKLDDDTFKEMVEVHPELRPLKELRGLISKLNIKTLPIGIDGRSRAMISPFSTKTSRNAPKGESFRGGETKARFMFGLPACLRSLIKPEAGKVLAYIDYSQQEFFVAATLSGDEAMKTAYKSGDPYLAFAKLAGAAPENATKSTHAEVRKLFKSCVLGVQYGLGAESLGYKIEKSTPYARELLSHHKRVFKTYWKWVDNYWNQASLEKRVRTCYRWKMFVIGSSNKEMLTVRNFPIQATGAEILRVACILLMEAGVKIIAPVHDAIMIECEIDGSDIEILKAKKIMEDASEVVLGVGNRLKTDVDVIQYPDRYIDEKGAETWEKIVTILNEVSGPVSEVENCANSSE
ncbi:MAG: DNA polymerase [Methanosarcina sp.]